MSSVELKNPLVSVAWLNDNLNAKNLIVLNASIKKITDSDKINEPNSIIPTARNFDLKNKFSDQLASFPNTIPSEKQFETEARALGIDRDSAIVIYDDKGIYSSPRAWWLFRTFGHKNVAVLDGGLPEWINAGYHIEPTKDVVINSGNFKSNYQSHLIKYFENIVYESTDDQYKIIDARSKNRFQCLAPEPRQGLRSGTIPNSLNIHYEDILDENRIKKIEDLKDIFNTFVNYNDKLTMSCGSGITACILALGAELSGYKNVSVYDGSWTEWGTLITE